MRWAVKPSGNEVGLPRRGRNLKTENRPFSVIVLESTLQGSPVDCRVLRGGAWNNNQDNARAAYRNNNNPNNRNNNIGFRVCRRCPHISLSPFPFYGAMIAWLWGECA